MAASVSTASYRWARAAFDAEPDRLWVPVRTSLGAPKFSLGYDIAEYCDLIAPHNAFRAKADYPRFKRMYLRQLDDIGHAAIAGRFATYAAEHGVHAHLVLLCFEDLSPAHLHDHPETWCHRRIFAEWFAEHAGVTLPELDTMAGPAVPPHPPEQASLF